MILIRAGQVLGLLFPIGPISDLASSSDSPAQKAAIAVVLGRDRLSHRPIGGRASRRDRERPAPLPLEAP